MTDIDLRKLRYFVAVAEELNFGRAAEALHIAQPVLSRQIRQLERELDVELFDRTNRRVTLTTAGHRLQEHAGPLLAASQAALEGVRRVADGTRTLSIGFMSGVNVAPILRAFSKEQPDVRIDMRHLDWDEQREALLDGRVDVSFVRRPLDEDGLVIVPLVREPRVAVLPADHPLAHKSSISVAELGADPVIQHEGADAAWHAFSTVDPRPDGTRAQRGPIVRTMEEKLEQIAAGRAIAFSPASAAESYRRPGIVYVPVDDIAPSEICLAYVADRRSPVIAAFLVAAQATIGAGEN